MPKKRSVHIFLTHPNPEDHEVELKKRIQPLNCPKQKWVQINLNFSASKWKSIFIWDVEPKIRGKTPPTWMVKIMENPMNKCMIWRYPQFLETSICFSCLFFQNLNPIEIFHLNEIDPPCLFATTAS